MAPVKRARFETTIDAPPEAVWDTMLADATYRLWTKAFCEGSYFDGDWREGSRMRFLAPDGDGMVAEIAQNERPRFLSIRHLGYIFKGVEDTESEAVRAWAPAYENYTFEPAGDGTRLIIDQDVAAEYEQFMDEAWPKALARLKALCEAR